MSETDKEPTKKSENSSEQEKSLQSDDSEVIKNREPREGSEPISDAGKKREEGRRYQ